MKKIKYIILFSFLLSLQNLFSQNLKEYYYPLDKLHKGKIYTFEVTIHTKDTTYFTEVKNYLHYNPKDSILTFKKGTLEIILKQDSEGIREIKRNSLLEEPVNGYLVRYTKKPYTYIVRSFNTGLEMYKATMMFDQFCTIDVLGKRQKVVKIKQIINDNFTYFYYAKNIGLVRKEIIHFDGTRTVYKLKKIN